MTSTRFIRLGIVFFWGAYFTLVFASNAADALKTMGALPHSFAFVSGNYALVAGLESTHVALLSAQLLSLLVFHAKLARRPTRLEPVQKR